MTLLTARKRTERDKNMSRQDVLTVIEDQHDAGRAHALLEDTYNQVLAHVRESHFCHVWQMDPQKASESTNKARDALELVVNLEGLLIDWQDYQADHAVEDCKGGCARDHAEEARQDWEDIQYHGRVDQWDAA